MKKSLLTFITLLILFTTQALSQGTRINGIIKNSVSGEWIPAASITIKGGMEGTYSNDKGEFRLTASHALPVVLIISSIGYETQEITITGTETITISMIPAYIMGDDLVIAATRLPTKILQSPVSIEKITLAKLKNSAATSYYDEIATLKGLDLTTSSIMYKTFSTRGFNISGSPRVNQIMDGMDNQSPALNFSVGNFVGLTDLDVESIEILPGASSALYGPGGMNGTILINSKDPFKYRGVSAMVRQGILHIDKNFRDKPGGFSDYSVRWASLINEKLAFKIGAQYIRAIDWLASDTTNYERSGSLGKVIPGTRSSDPNYDGVNVYGDETKVDIRAFLTLPPSHPLMASPLRVSRTGYYEKDVVDPETNNLKLAGALHYKITDRLEARFVANWSTGQTVYTGSNRFAFTNIKLAQYKLELKHKYWLLKGYTTQGDAGETYSATTTMQVFNESWKRSFNPSNIPGSWYPQYAGAFQAAIQGGASTQNAHNAARAYADMGRPSAGSATFKQIFDQVRKVPIPGGGLFIDKSDIWFGEAQYNFLDKIKFAEITGGFNYKKSILDSRGTIFIDTTGKLKVSEWGTYIQAAKKIFKEVVKVSFSARYDKNKNFEGQFTPRYTALISVAKNHNIRISYQSAYRFPTNTDLFIKLNVGSGVFLVGGLPWIVDYMNIKQYPAYKVKDDGSLETTAYQYKKLSPETSKSFETGYKGLIKNSFLIDFYLYFANYENFLGRNVLYQPATNRSYSILVNSNAEVKTYGWGLGLDYLLPKHYILFFTVYSDVITKIPSAFIGGFNTPKYRVNAGVSNSGLGTKKNIGFNLSFRWQESFLYERDFASGIVNSFATLDAQVNYKFRKIKSVLKVGATNITNHYYQNGFGNPMIGGLYYASLAYNLF